MTAPEPGGAVEPQASGPRIPAATYRVQFNASFTFRDAAELVPYLHTLGISDLYASPILRARSTSTHGYDICDPAQLNPSLGSTEDFEHLVAELHARGMGLLLDTVPNHMGIGETCNVWWMDVLENGPSSVYSRFFDIDWHPVKPEFENKVLLPMLEDQYGAVLESGKLRLTYEDGAFFVCYYETKLPVAPCTYQMVLEQCLERLRELVEEDGGAPAGGDAADAAQAAVLPLEPAAVLPTNEHVLELQSILTALGHLPPRTETDPARIAERMREKEVVKRRLAALHGASAEMQTALEETLQLFNGTPGDPKSMDLLDALLEEQTFRVAFWRVAGEEINYRRFFDINDLAAIRVEVPEVFQATHVLTLRLLRNGQVTGLRIDHPDGLWDPTTYFRRLQDSYVAAVQEAVAAAEQAHGEAQDRTGQNAGLPARQPARPGAQGSDLALYVVAEKILSEREPLPQEWAVYGTTGYDFLASVNNLFVHRANEQVFERIYTQFIGRQIDLADLVIASKISVMRDSLSSEINALSHHLERIGERNRHYRDFTLNGITAALREVIACLPVYRTYINAITGEVPERDRKFVEASVRTARRRRPVLADAIFDFIRDTLLLRNMEDFAEPDRADLANFVMKFQQLSGPVMAKGVEDTIFYIYNRLVSLNEVGSSPDQFGIGLPEFHRDNTRRAQRWPHSMVATSTHDNKRSEDVRARIDVLSEIPEMWRTALARWARLNNSKKVMQEGSLAPDRNDEYMLYQTLLGTWPLATAVSAIQEQAGSPGHENQQWTGELPAGPLAAELPTEKKNGTHGSGEAVGAADSGDEEPSIGAKDAGRHARSKAWSFLLAPSDSAEFQEFRKRIVSYTQKAAREAKVHTSWINPDAEYDAALQSFVERLLAPGSNNIFLREFAPLAHRVAYYGQFNSLSQTLLKLTVPGVPDIYQGNEVWDFSLVDPDNRRPVDYAARRVLLDDLQARLEEAHAAGDHAEGLLLELAEELLSNIQDGRLKLYITSCILDYRRQHRALFDEGAYVPLQPIGSKRDYACSFVRQHGDAKIVVVAPRLLVGLTNDIARPPVGLDAWEYTWLPLPGDEPGMTYRNLFTSEVLHAGEGEGQAGLPLATILGYFPVALLERGA